MAVLLRVSLGHAAPPSPTDGTDCSARGPASYILVFTGLWSPQTFPKQYPMFRPPAQWSKLIGEGSPPRCVTAGVPGLDAEGVFAGVASLPCLTEGGPHESTVKRGWRALNQGYYGYYLV